MKTIRVTLCLWTSGHPEYFLEGLSLQKEVLFLVGFLLGSHCSIVHDRSTDED